VRGRGRGGRPPPVVDRDYATSYLVVMLIRRGAIVKHRLPSCRGTRRHPSAGAAPRAVRSAARPERSIAAVRYNRRTGRSRSDARR